MAVMEGSTPKVIENAEGMRTTPSFVGAVQRVGEFCACACVCVFFVPRVFFCEFCGGKFLGCFFFWFLGMVLVMIKYIK